MMFNFVVNHLHGLARIPLLPQIFDGLLLAWSGAFQRERITAIELIEAYATRMLGVRLCTHRFGGIGFVMNSDEFAHVHGNGLLDVRLTVAEGAKWISSGRALPHHVAGRSSWISFWLRSEADAANGIALLERGRELAVTRKLLQ